MRLPILVNEPPRDAHDAIPVPLSPAKGSTMPKVRLPAVLRRQQMRTRRLCLLLLALSLLGCGARDSAKRYPMQGDVKAVDPAAKTATIAAGKIGDWMEPMTMAYPVKPDAELAKLHAGDRIEATVVVEGDKFYVTNVRVAPKQ